MKNMRERQTEHVKSCSVYFKTAFKHATPVWDSGQAALRFPSLHSCFSPNQASCIKGGIGQRGNGAAACLHMPQDELRAISCRLSCEIRIQSLLVSRTTTQQMRVDLAAVLAAPEHSLLEN